MNNELKLLEHKQVKTIDYAMTKSYRRNWGLIEAVREIVQNSLDNAENPSTYTYEGGVITITTKGYELPLSAFAMGESEKARGSIGGFGEGFKLALMIITRENQECSVVSGNYVVKPYFEINETVQRETFRIDIIESKDFYSDDTIFTFTFPEDKFKELQHKINVFAEEVMPLPASVDIIKDAGKIMVNGLFVCQEERFKYGYNFAPTRLKLGCDREIADGLGMAWETSQVWAEKINSDNADEVLNMLTEQRMDVSDLNYHISKSGAEIVAKAFTERFGHVEIKRVGSSLGYGMSVGGSLYNTMAKSGYTKVANEWEENGTPFNLIREFIESEKKHMRRHARKEADKLLEMAKGWKKK